MSIEVWPGWGWNTRCWSSFWNRDRTLGLRMVSITHLPVTFLSPYFSVTGSTKGHIPNPLLWPQSPGLLKSLSLTEVSLRDTPITHQWYLIFLSPMEDSVLFLSLNFAKIQILKVYNKHVPRPCNNYKLYPRKVACLFPAVPCLGVPSLAQFADVLFYLY